MARALALHLAELVFSIIIFCTHHRLLMTERAQRSQLRFASTVDFILHGIPVPPPPHHGKFMICVGHTLQCKLANITNHKFCATGP